MQKNMFHFQSIASICEYLLHLTNGSEPSAEKLKRPSAFELRDANMQIIPNQLFDFFAFTTIFRELIFEKWTRTCKLPWSQHVSANTDGTVKENYEQKLSRNERI